MTNYLWTGDQKKEKAERRALKKARKKKKKKKRKSSSSDSSKSSNSSSSSSFREARPASHQNKAHARAQEAPGQLTEDGVTAMARYVRSRAASGALRF